MAQAMLDNSTIQNDFPEIFNFNVGNAGPTDINNNLPEVPQSSSFNQPSATPDKAILPLQPHQMEIPNKKRNQKEIKHFLSKKVK